MEVHRPYHEIFKRPADFRVSNHLHADATGYMIGSEDFTECVVIEWIDQHSL